MPKINRFRIINFSYNNDNRHIVDETFNFFGGENALLSLANGGGKSVLVQLMLQVVVPKAKIQGRKFEDFFKNKKQPTFLLAEWKLDYSDNYLLTGFVCENFETTQLDGEKNQKLRFFTFTVLYSEANSWDIQNLKIIQKSGKIINLPGFKETCKIMEEKERNPAFDFRVFRDDNMESYRQHIGEYGISANEWNNIIKGINDSEGGLEEIFQKCRTSDQLINEWFLNKTILKVLFKDKKSSLNLSMMMKNLLDEIISNERFIIEKNILGKFLIKLEDFSQELEKFASKIEKLNVLIQKLNRLKAFCFNNIEKLKNTLDNNYKILSDCESSLNLIDFEERSLHFYNYKSKCDELMGEIDFLNKETDEISEILNSKKYFKNCMKASQLNNKIQKNNAFLAGINQKLKSFEDNFNFKDEVAKLEYSLKINYEQKYKFLEKEYENLKNKVEDVCNNIESSNDDIIKIQSELDYLREQKGAVRSAIEMFKDYAGSIEGKLNIKIQRNILGNIEPSFFENTNNFLKSECLKLHNQIKQNSAELEKNQNQLNQSNMKLKKLESQKVEKLNHVNINKENIKNYNKQEKKLKRIFDKYEFDFTRRFNNEYCVKLFNFKIHEFEEKKHNARLENDQILKIIHGINNNQLHIQKNIIDLLIKNDINFDTGEKYLLNQNKKIAAELKEKNPLLPYSLIFDTQNLEKLKSLKINHFIECIVPVLLFEDIEMSINFENRVSNIEKLYFFSNFENKLFNNDNKLELIQELQLNVKREKEKIQNFQQCINNLYKEKNSVSEFDFSADYLQNQQNMLSHNRKEFNKIIQEFNAIEDKIKKTQIQCKKKEHENLDLEKKQQKGKQKLEIFDEFKNKNLLFEENCLNLKNLSDKINLNEAEIKEKSEKILGLTNSKFKLKQDIEKIENNIEKTKILLKKYDEVAENEIIEGDISELENRLNSLKNQYEADLSFLNQRKEEICENIINFESQLKKIKVEKKDYLNLSWEKKDYENIIIEIEELNNKKSALKETEIKAERVLAGEKKALEFCVEEIKKLGFVAAIPYKKIYGDFKVRREKLKNKKSSIENENKQINQELINLEKIYSSINDLGLPKNEININFDKEINLKKDYEILKSEYLKLKNEIYREENKVINFNYNLIKNEFKEKNKNIQKLFFGLDSIILKENKNYEDYYYLYERVKQNQEKIKELVRIYENRLQNLEKNKKDVIYQSYLHGERIFNQLIKISKNSTVKIPGRMRPVEMIKINIEIDNQKQALERTQKHIENTIENVREEIRKGLSQQQIMKTINRLMSSRELLNKYTNLTSIPVFVYKIDLNHKASGHKLWEKAVSENSGGEKFVVFFAVISALMSYIRENTMENAEVDKLKDTRVLIMDNPFGPVSSEHLLTPLFEIAKKYKTQLICLSDLKQHSIMNCFNLIYMLKIKTTSFDKNEFLKLEYEIKNNQKIQFDENLEKSIFRAQTKEIQNLF
ncbi:MAG: hypothetical protein ACQESP_02080 [Candidatus Muiribacteriota bacterium]